MLTLSRRTLLLGVGGLPALAACTGEPEAPAPVSPDVALRAAAVARERSLLQAYDDAVAAVPALAPLLQGLRAEHQVHLEALLGPATASPSPTPAASASAAPPVVPPVLPTEPAARRTAVLQALSGAETTHGREHATAALGASRGLAAVLGQLAASEASHPLVLR